MWETGETLSDSEKERDRTTQYIRGAIDTLKDLDNVNPRFRVVEGTIAQIRRAPLGVILCMGQHNYPFNETFSDPSARIVFPCTPRSHKGAERVQSSLEREDSSPMSHPLL